MNHNSNVFNSTLDSTPSTNRWAIILAGGDGTAPSLINTRKLRSTVYIVNCRLLEGIEDAINDLSTARKRS